MPQQTSLGRLIFPDGAMVGIDTTGGGSFEDVGALNSAITAAFNWVENQVTTANFGKSGKQIREMTMEGGFTLINYDPSKIALLGGGVFEEVTTAASPIATIPDQTIAAGWADQTLYPLILETSSSDDTLLRTTSAPTLTSVTLDPTGTPEVLVEDTEYVVVADSSSYSGWSIQFISANMATGSPTTFEIVVDYGSNTPVASTTLHAGTSTKILSAYAIQITHTDSNSKIRRLTIHSVEPTSGGFQFNFKGANEDGLEEIPITFNGKIDTDLTDGRQLLSLLIEDGAE